MMHTCEISYDTSRLQRAMNLYYGLSSKSESEVIRKQARELDNDIRRGLRSASPLRGSIRSTQLAEMRSTRGRGLKVRQAAIESVARRYNLVLKAEKVVGGKPVFGSKVASWSEKTHVKVKGKKLNLRQLAVMRELNIRESGIGFLATSVPRTSDQEGTITTDSRYGAKLSEFTLNAVSVEDKYALLRWVGGKGTALQGMSQPMQLEVITQALDARIDDMVKHMSDRVGFDVKEAGLV